MKKEVTEKKQVYVCDICEETEFELINCYPDEPHLMGVGYTYDKETKSKEHQIRACRKCVDILLHHAVKDFMRNKPKL